jgi:hypothetical protein
MTRTLRPFMSYYGGKWMTAGRYPAPMNSTIVEPFAGAAGYATRHANRRVVLVDASPQVAGVWSYLIRASRDEVESLPLLEHGQSVNDLPVCQEARWLIGWWVNKGAAQPYLTLSAWARDPQHASQFWGPRIRSRIAEQVGSIRHWEIIQGNYRAAEYLNTPDTTWFIDPPYQSDAGRRYPFHHVDYPELAIWSKARTGQAIVCEHEGADWLPFASVGETYSTVARRTVGRATAREVMWTN